MSRLLKILSGVCIAVLVGLIVLGPMPVFLQLKQQARSLAEEVVRNQHPADFVKIEDVTNIPGFKWEDEGTEFSINGERYDVVRMITHHGHTTYYCYNDKEETRICKQIDFYTSLQTDNPGTPGGKNMVHLLSLVCQPFIAPDVIWSAKVCYSCDCELFFPSVEKFISRSGREVQIPPPRLAA